MTEVSNESPLKEGGYSTFIKETPYVGQFPDIPEFVRPWGNAIQIEQGQARTSLRGRPLQSEGFSRCTGLIIQKNDGIETFGAHIDEFHLKDGQLDILSNLPPGKYIGRFIRGSLSRNLRETEMNPRISLFSSVFAKGKELEILEDIVVDTGDLHWAFVYRPESHLFLIQSKNTHTIKEFKLMD